MKPYRFLKKNYTVFLLGLLLSITSCSFTTKKIDPGDNDKEEVLSELITFVLENYHYSPKDIDKEFSKNVYKEYLKSLDPEKRFFLKKDIEEFAEYENSLDEELKDNSVAFFNLTYDRLQKRINEMESVYNDYLDEPFDFDEDDEINTDSDEIDYPENKEEREARWRKQLKFNALSSYHDLKKEEKEKEKRRKEKKDEGDEASSDTEDEEDNAPKSDEELEEEARKSTQHSLDQFYDITEDLDKDDWFSMYLNAIANEFDPHTGYFPPEEKDRFDIAMSGSLEGIGAQLQKDMDNIKVTKLISGGPAWTDGSLQVGDVIKKVMQEDEDKAVSIVGMSINDAVELIKGPKGSKVTLTVKSVDGSTKTIELIRDKVEIEETYAKSAITEKDDKKFGLIKLPSFYFDMEDYNQRNAASDMKKEISYLKNQGMEGLVVDLRDNGGGSLSTAIDIAGLFLKKGPVVQVRSGDNQQKTLKNENRSVEWDGPLVILVNELSASASEILSAAVQDFGRGVIIGSKQTYGKGTVQKFLDLNRFMRNDKLGDIGSLKITAQKFYRINGGATQLKGVESDVVTPDHFSYIDIGERDMEGPLPWDEIESVKYNQWEGYTNLDESIMESQKRVDKNEHFKLIDDNAKWIKSKRDESVFPLSYEAYSTKVKTEEEKAEEFKVLSEYKTDLTYNSLPEEVERFEADSTLQKKRKRWHKNLKKDVYLEEAINILEDLELSPTQQEKMAKAKK